jgi:hypothetical protein
VDDEMRKKIIWIVLLIVSHAAAFFGGSVVGGKVSKSYLYQEFEKANAEIMLSHYVQFRDFAKSVKTGNLDNAKCSAELGASSNLDAIRTCLKNNYCKAAIEKEVSQQAPEIISGSPLAFDYKPADGAIRRCE